MTSSAKENEELKSAKRINDEERDHTCGHRSTSEVITGACAWQQQLSFIDPSDVTHCKSILSKDTRHERRHHNNALMNHTKSTRKDKHNDTDMRET